MKRGTQEIKKTKKLVTADPRAKFASIYRPLKNQQFWINNPRLSAKYVFPAVRTGRLPSRTFRKLAKNGI
jgi:hypothetical protein